MFAFWINNFLPFRYPFWQLKIETTCVSAIKLDAQKHDLMQGNTTFRHPMAFHLRLNMQKFKLHQQFNIANFKRFFHQAVK